jgi:hypothetical protein
MKPNILQRVFLLDLFNSKKVNYLSIQIADGMKSLFGRFVVIVVIGVIAVILKPVAGCFRQCVIPLILLAIVTSRTCCVAVHCWTNTLMHTHALRNQRTISL